MFNVNTIGSQIFENCKQLSSVNMHPFIKCIGNSDFSEFLSLKQNFVPTLLKYFEFRVFASCPIENIHFPPGILSIEKWDFKDCRQLLYFKKSIQALLISMKQQLLL